MLEMGKLNHQELKLQLFYNQELGDSLYKLFCEEMKAGKLSPFFRCQNLGIQHNIRQPSLFHFKAAYR